MHHKNTASFSKDIKVIKIEKGEIMNSHDVVSLFTNVPIREALIIIRRKLRSDKTLHRCTNLTADDIMELLKFLLSTTYFSYNGEIYKQIQGAPMGSPVSVVVSNLYMEDHEETAIATAPQDMKPQIWKRYVDNLFEIIKKDQRDPFPEHLNSIDATGSIKFTDEPQVDKTIPFQDTQITRKDDGSLKVKVYRKKHIQINTLTSSPTIPPPQARRHQDPVWQGG